MIKSWCQTSVAENKLPPLMVLMSWEGIAVLGGLVSVPGPAPGLLWERAKPFPLFLNSSPRVLGGEKL